MANPLSEANWTSLTKKLKLDLDDAALVKTLTRFDKTDPAKPEPRLDALKDLIEQIKKQTLALAKRKKELGDKPFAELKNKLDDLLDLAEREQKAMRSAAESGDEEEESPVLLTAKMLPLLREIRKGEIRMHALIGVAGKDCAVLILRRAISPARRKLIAETLGATGGIKYITGECLFENKVLTFVVQSQAAGLAKKLRQALLDQTQLRFKVKVRGEDGDDEHGEDEEDATTPPAESTPAHGANAAPGPAQAPAAPGTDANAGPAFKARLEALLPRLKPGLPGADVARAKATEAGVLTRSRDWAGAGRLLDEAEAALTAAATSAAAATPEHPRGTIAPSIVYTQSRLAWLASRKKVEGELKKLEQAILDRYKTNAALPAVVQGVRKLDRVLEVFDESLADTLDAALNAVDPAVKQRLHEEARGIIHRYEDFLKTDPMVRELDSNPFVPIGVQSTLTSTLSVLAAKIL